MVPHLYIGVPCYGGNLQAGFAQSLLELRALLIEKRVTHDIEFLIGESLIDRARNNIAAKFLRSGATHLMFIDSDIDFEAADVIKLLVQSEENGYDIVGGAYATKTLDFTTLVNRARQDAAVSADELVRQSTRVAIDFLKPVDAFETATGCVEVKHIATGFMMIRRRVLEKIAMAKPDLLYLNDHPGDFYGEPLFDFFEVRRGCHGWDSSAPHLGRKLSEDYGFCDLWRDLGGQVWCNLEIQLGHTGPMRFTGEAAKQVSKEIPLELDKEWLDIASRPDHPHAAFFIERYVWASKYIKNCKVANAACGTNYGAAILADSKNAVTGFDVDADAVAVAVRDGLTPVVVADVATLDLNGFDALVSLETLEHLERPFEWLKQLAPSVKKLVSSVPCIPTIHFNPFHKHDFTVESFVRGLHSAGWIVKETWVQNQDDLLVYAERR